MPFIDVQLLQGRSEEQRAAFARAVTDAAVETLGAEADRVRIRFIDIAPGYLARGGELVQGTTKGQGR